MRLLNHLDPKDHKLLEPINDDWPFQFLSEFSRFHNYYYGNKIILLYDVDLDAYMPLRLYNLVIVHPAQILHAPVRNAQELSAEEQLIFFNKMIRFLKDWGQTERLLQPHPYGILATYPENSRHCEFGTYVIDLASQSEEEIFSRFHPKYQKAVMHSIKHNATVRFGKSTLEDFFSVYKSTMIRAKLEYDKIEYFESLYDYLGENRVCSGVVYDEGVPVSGIFVINTHYAALLTHAGTAGESRLYGAAKLLNLEMMKRLKKQGILKYDFVGVRLNNKNPSLEGIFRFKKGFGGELKRGYLWKIDIDPYRSKIYQILNKVRTKNKDVKDIIDQVND
jgi:lipid II:glycine glycyltransferase (peptidoglycan interpeptide bridge formation enzyme)